MGGAVLYTIMLLIAPLAVRSSCLGPYSRCRVGSDSARVDHDLPQLKTAQRQLLFQWEEEEGRTLTQRSRRPRRQSPERRSRSRRRRGVSSHQRRANSPARLPAAGGTVPGDSFKERWHLGDSAHCMKESSDPERAADQGVVRRANGAAAAATDEHHDGVPTRHRKAAGAQAAMKVQAHMMHQAARLQRH